MNLYQQEGCTVLKPFKSVLWILLLSISLITGCGQAEQADPGFEEKKKKELTPAQVLEKATKAAEKQTGLHFDTTMDQTLNMETNGMKQSMDQNMEMEIQMTREPLAMHAKGTINMNESIPMEMYFADMTYYMKNPQGDEWSKMEIPGNFDKEKFEELLNQSSSEDPQAMLEQLKPFQNDLKMTHEKGMYIITLELNEEQSQKYMDVIVEDKMDQILNMMKDTGVPGEEEMKSEMDKFLKNMKIHDLKQTFHIDEKTFEQKKVDQKLNMEMMLEGNKIKTDQKMSMEIKGGVDQITIPDEVKANAVDMGNMKEMDGMGQQ